MLRFFAKFQRSRNLVLFAFCIVLLIGLVAFYIPNTPLDPSQRLSAASADDGTVIAKVGSQEIKLKQYRQQLLQMAQSFGRGNSIPLGMLKQFGADKLVLDQLISTRIVIDQASKLGLTGTNREISDLIRSRFTDESGKWMGSEEYQRRLRYEGIDVGEFEQEQRDAITARKFREYLTSAEQVSDRDIEDRYKKDNTKVEAVYVTVDIEKIRQSYKPGDEELKAYYESHKNDFKAAEPTRKVDYIFISSEDAAKVVPVTDEELRKEYETRKQFEYRASVIKLNVLTPQDNDTVRNKINELAAKVRGAEGVKPEDFAVVAKGNSQDTASAPKGGDIGWIKKELNKKNDWRQRIYNNNLQVNEIDGPFLEGKSWYLMKVTEQREVPFEQMRDTMKATVSNNKAYTKASELANLAYEKATEFKDLRKAADEIARQLNVPAASLIKSTPYFKKGDSLVLGNSTERSNVPAFEDAVTTLKKGEIGDKVGIPGGQAVPQVVDLIENGQQLTFEQAHNQVENKLRSEKEPTLAQSKAQEIVSQAKDAEDFKAKAKAAGLEIKTDTNFNSYSFSGPGGTQAGNQARAALANLKEGEVFKTPVKNGLSYLIFAATKRTEADLSKLSGQRDMLRQSLVSERRNAAFEAFVKSTQKLYEQQGKIKIYQDRIDKFFASASPQQ